MRSWRITDAELRQWLQRLIDGAGTVIAPASDDGLLVYRPISSADEAVVEASGITRWSAKERLLPRTETLYAYTASGNEVTVASPPTEPSPQVLFGVPSCDAAGLLRLDDVLLSGIEDPFYAARRRATTVVSIACAEAAPECFCTAVGGSPAGVAGVDVRLAPLGEGWLVEPLTERGGELVAAAGVAGWQEATAEDRTKVVEMEHRVASSIGREPVPPEWAELLEAGFDHQVWERIGWYCLGCSVCASVCPSCSCFDMHHEADVFGGEELRTWDACTFALFTRHASGHNPRSTQAQRFRQRLLHKLAFRRSDEPVRCVGCGRCVALCPAGLDIHSEVVAAAAAIAEEVSNGTG
jgi:ferredoxin